MTALAADSPGAACRRALDAALASPDRLDPALLVTLAAADQAVREDALRAFADAHGAAALPALVALAAEPAGRDVRRSAKRALYRLAQRGIVPERRPAARPVVKRREERATRAWLTGVDGSGSRATWILFDGGSGSAALCSLIVNDTVGIVDAAGGEITKKRLERELDTLRASQKLPWVEVAPERAVALAAEALALHRTLGTSPPPAFARWQRLFESVAAPPQIEPAHADPQLAERAAELLELPELGGWFVDPEDVQVDALEILQARESRLVVADQIKADREEAIVTRVVEREFPPEVRQRWAKRLAEMAFIFRETGRPEQAALADAAAAALADGSRDAARDPFARALARRGLEVAGEVVVGRVSAADVSRRPAPRA